jgi:hypothetical protein
MVVSDPAFATGVRLLVDEVWIMVTERMVFSFLPGSKVYTCRQYIHLKLLFISLILNIDIAKAKRVNEVVPEKPYSFRNLIFFRIFCATLSPIKFPFSQLA